MTEERPWWNPEEERIDRLVAAVTDALEAIADSAEPPWKPEADRCVESFARDLTRARRYFNEHRRHEAGLFIRMADHANEAGYVLRRLLYLAVDGDLIEGKRGTQAILPFLSQINCDHFNYPERLSSLLTYFRDR
ncbi:MAG: hypothetical protein HYY13_01530 [Nitrospirae bacterium]|nr:hypothetical protein [Nitrospirota bacterium]